MNFQKNMNELTFKKMKQSFLKLDVIMGSKSIRKYYGLLFDMFEAQKYSPINDVRYHARVAFLKHYLTHGSSEHLYQALKYHGYAINFKKYYKRCCNLK